MIYGNTFLFREPSFSRKFLRARVAAAASASLNAVSLSTLNDGYTYTLAARSPSPAGGARYDIPGRKSVTPARPLRKRLLHRPKSLPPRARTSQSLPGSCARPCLGRIFPPPKNGEVFAPSARRRAFIIAAGAAGFRAGPPAWRALKLMIFRFVLAEARPAALPGQPLFTGRATPRVLNARAHVFMVICR